MCAVRGSSGPVFILILSRSTAQCPAFLSLRRGGRSPRPALGWEGPDRLVIVCSGLSGSSSTQMQTQWGFVFVFLNKSILNYFCVQTDLTRYFVEDKYYQGQLVVAESRITQVQPRFMHCFAPNVILLKNCEPITFFRVLTFYQIGFVFIAW